MTPLPAVLGGGGLVAWRLDRTTRAVSFDSGEGAFRAGGHWNSKGVRAVYCAIDPATAILEVAVHKGFKALDIVPHALTAINVIEPSSVHVVQPAAVPDRDWLRPGIPTPGQQTFGDNLLAKHKFIAIPSTVSALSWNLIFVAARATGAYAIRMQEPFVLDPRLHAVPQERKG